MYELVRALEVLLLFWMGAGLVAIVNSLKWNDAAGVKVGKTILGLSFIFFASLHFLFHGF